MKKEAKKPGLSRRDFIKGLGGGVIGTGVLISSISRCSPQKTGPHNSVIFGPEPVNISLKINGKKHSVNVEPRISLLDVIRDRLGYTGTKRVCNRGQCGACTVIMQGKTVLACSILAVDAHESEIETIEGLAMGDRLHPLQESFIEHDALQCGFCTSGFIMSGVSLLRSNKNPTMDEIRDSVSGNLCRCGTYPNIFKAMAGASETMRKGG